jgi:hypothetical protein
MVCLSLRRRARLLKAMPHVYLGGEGRRRGEGCWMMRGWLMRGWLMRGRQVLKMDPSQVKSSAQQEVLQVYRVQHAITLEEKL